MDVMFNAASVKGFAESLRLLLASCFVVQMLVGFVGLAVPIYAAGMGASPLLVGVIGAMGGLTYSFMPLAAGFLSVKVGRKSLLLAALFLYGFACAIYLLAQTPSMLVPIKVVEWIAVAIFWPSAEVLLTELSEHGIERNLRRFNLSWGSAAIISPITGGALISFLGVKMPFVLSSAATFALAIIAAAKIEEPLDSKHENFQPGAKDGGSCKEPIAAAVVSITLFAFIGGVIYNLFPAQATSLGIPAYEIGLIIFANGFFRLIAFTKAYKIEARIGRTCVFLTGALTLATASALTAVSSTTLLFALSFAIFGFGMGILYASSIAHILEGGSRARGYAAGMFESLLGVGTFLGSSTGGLASDYYAPNAPYILCLLISLAVAFYQTTRLSKHNSHQRFTQTL
ncbi:MAG: MFS transporter [Candidatus Bathyarchaeia archaeon]